MFDDDDQMRTKIQQIKVLINIFPWLALQSIIW